MHNRAGVFLECLQKACRNNGCDFDTLAKNLPAEPLVLGSAGYDTIVEATGHCLLEVYHFIIDKARLSSLTMFFRQRALCCKSNYSGDSSDSNAHLCDGQSHVSLLLLAASCLLFDACCLC